MAVNQATPSSASGTSTGNVTNPVDGTTTVITSNLVDVLIEPTMETGRGVLISLSAKNKLGFTNRTCQKPDERSPLFERWRRCNGMVIAWLLNSLSKDIAESVIYAQTAEELWSE
uniref:Uncharacterized protein LOC104244663 n=1 Tax=Nicotiana sylvestris TaxID=4096 RepID=A0A1U7Y2V1_NICSY|nr:PREDICTED: uncharacterized protein LOC104244663 [Nicotiana sylvestris]